MRAKPDHAASPPRSLIAPPTGRPSDGGWRGWYARRGATAVNLAVCGSLAALLVWDARAHWLRHGFDYVQVSFVAQTVLMLLMILARAPQRAIDVDLRHQAVALAAFASAALFAEEPATTRAGQHAAAVAVMVTANVLGALTILNLGRAFGILVALRRVETRGLYRLVRHPMYLTDLLLRVGLVLEVTTARNVAVAVGSAVLYLWRARLEERFLSHDPAYRAYLARVRWRFVPGLY
jgi:protein-S-isoprenylcysteine O-methyltransferase Ste14